MNWIVTGRALKCSRFTNVCRFNLINYSKPASLPKSDYFVPIYNFPHVKIAGLLNRLKVYQTVATVVSVPGGIILNNAGFLNFDIIATAWIVGKIEKSYVNGNFMIPD